MAPGIRRDPWIKQSYRSQQNPWILEKFGKHPPYSPIRHPSLFRAFQSLPRKQLVSSSQLVALRWLQMSWWYRRMCFVPWRAAWIRPRAGSASTTALGIEVDHSGSCRSGIRSTGVESAREVSVEFAGQSFSQSAPPAGQLWKHGTIHRRQERDGVTTAQAPTRAPPFLIALTIVVRAKCCYFSRRESTDE
ncbi:predicted protein [Histoplasma capsulatum G186AR]|uniref:Uncharacterized protein n=1 Tax=Ajellomyces capsulatus (strain G186AR / H82 / ATCC MYA-2454 / RMSCC 2432) TaxID=447093 RepID=C0NZ20_AJECG|nr:uncharacterized protein HCBG_08400 [Histoplasma capsulatum G186AR]EEH03460.1 predicted protein [Histoplasma capsulatum G186AR]